MSNQTVEREPTLPPELKLLVTHQEMAARLSVGTTVLDELVDQGCPRINLGKRCPRYHPPDVLAWLRRRNMEGDGVTHPTGQGVGDPMDRSAA